MSWQKAEDQALVEQTVRLAKLMLQGNFAKGLTPGEVKRLMGYIQTAVGRPTDAGDGRRNAGTQDPVAAAKSIVDLLALNQLRTMKSMVSKMMQVKTSKVNSQGVEVQAKSLYQKAQTQPNLRTISRRRLRSWTGIVTVTVSC